MFAVVPEIKAVYEHVLHFIIFNGGGGGGYVVQRHVFSEGVYSQSSHKNVEKWQKSVTYFLNGPLCHFGVRLHICLTRLPNFEPHYSG